MLVDRLWHIGSDSPDGGKVYVGSHESTFKPDEVQPTKFEMVGERSHCSITSARLDTRYPLEKRLVGRLTSGRVGLARAGRGGQAWRAGTRVGLGALASQLLGQLGLQVAVVLLAAGHIFGLVALERVDVEDGAQAAAVGARHALYADVELAAVGGVGVAGVVTRLVDLARVGADEAVAHFGLIAALD